MKIEGLYTGTILKCTHINDMLKDDIDEFYGFFRYNYEMYKENVLLAKIENGGYVEFDKLNSLINRIKIGKDIHKNGWCESYSKSFYGIIFKRRLIMTKEDAKKIILGTGSYEDVKCGNTVSVTGDGGNAWNYFGPAYKKLAPKLVTYVPYQKSIKNY